MPSTTFSSITRHTLFAGIAFATTSLFASEAAPGVSPETALQLLISGNQRFASGLSAHPHAGIDRREEVAKGQKPFAIIVSCSDSRVGPEVVFDQGLGDLFVVRTAGHVIDPVCLGSIEYAAEHLGSSLILVLGHEKCGAVSATVAGGEPHAHLPSLLDQIKPAVESVKDLPGNTVENAVCANVVRVTEQLRKAEPVLSEMVKAGKLKVIGARYDLESGKVEIVDDGISIPRLLTSHR